MSERKQNPEVLLEILDLEDARVADIGCGTGHLTRLMARQGAEVIGIECSQIQLSKALAEDRIADEVYVDGVAETLPLPDGSLDIVVFANSLHHVPMEHQERALKEAARVLVPGGLVYISEPLAEGSHFDVMQPVHDETAVRARAYEAIRKAAAFGFEQALEMTHVHIVRHKTYESFRKQITSINPQTEGRFIELDFPLREAFHRLGTQGDDGWAFDQPNRVNVLRKTG